jgi:hypothetical protein
MSLLKHMLDGVTSMKTCTDCMGEPTVNGQLCPTCKGAMIVPMEVSSRMYTESEAVEVAATVPAAALGSTFTGKVRGSYVMHVAGLIEYRCRMQSKIESLRKKIDCGFKTVTLGLDEENNFLVSCDGLIRFIEMEIVRVNEDLTSLRVIPGE